MSCYHPLHAFDVGIRTSDNKIKYQIESGDVERVRKKNMIWTDKYIEIPCGHCIGCRLDYSREWATRCTLEANEHKDNYFLTLTYAPEYLPVRLGATLDGEITNVATLVPKHLQDFLKRLRIYYKRHYDIENIRFFACGEYGEEKKRPHYHLIIFGLPIPDLTYFTTNLKSKEICYRSPLLEKLWTYGIVGIGKVTWESCAYVARYIVKKQKGPNAKEYYAALNIEPEFVRMSRRPGIALDYYLKNKDKIYQTDEIFVSKKSGVIKAKPSRYYDRKFDLDEPELMKEIKDRRVMLAKEALKQRLEQTDLTKDELFALMERSKEQSLKKLVRNLHKNV